MKKILLSLLAIVLLLEEWLWDVLNQSGRMIVQFLNWQRYEQWLIQCQPIQALWCFLVPLMLVTPINWLAIMLLARGLLWQGVMLEVAVKLFTTLIIARIFTLTKPQLLSYPLLNWGYETISQWLRWAHRKLADTAAYRWAQQLKVQIKATLRQWIKDKRL